MKMKFLLLSALSLLLFSCDKSEDNSEIIPPAPANLVFPANFTECNEGTVVDADNSSVNFQWEAAENTTSYELYLEDLESNILHQESTTETELEITIQRGKTFRWYVQSKSDGSAEPASSEVWSFYNAGEGTVSHAPFPAEILSPSPGASFSLGNGAITLEWSGNDLDNDINEYEVYFGGNNPPETLEEVTSEETLEINPGSTGNYYWQVKTFDNNGNSSNSRVSLIQIK